MPRRRDRTAESGEAAVPLPDRLTARSTGMRSSVQIGHRTDATRQACASTAALRRTFAEAWEMISLALTILAKAANLAEVVQFACVALHRVSGTSRAAWY